jgi:hypothetical protein
MSVAPQSSRNASTPTSQVVTLRRKAWWTYKRLERKLRLLRRIRKRLWPARTETIFVSFPKSGRTWVRFVLGRAIQRQFHMAENKKLVLNRPLYKRATDRFIRITHNLGAKEDVGYSGMDKSDFAGKDVFLLARDIRDTLVSYYHHRYDRNREIDMTVSEYVRSEIYGARKIALFYKSWHDNTHLPRSFLRMQYEDLRKDPFARMRQIADFLHLGFISDAVLRAACEEGEFSNMRRLERNNEIVLLRKAGDASGMSENAARIRKGKVGGFRDELTDDDLAYIDQIVAEVGVPRDWVYYEAS